MKTSWIPRTILALVLSVALCSISARASQAQPAAAEVQAGASTTSASFEENRGQVDAQVRFISRAAGSTVFLTAAGAVYVLPMADRSQAFALRMTLAGASANPVTAGEQRNEGIVNYFRGQDQTKWLTNVPTFQRVRYRDVYPGVGMVWSGRERSAVQYQFELAARADPTQIRLAFEGADSLSLDAQGNLVIDTAAGNLIQTRPVAYQPGSSVPSRFRIDGNTVGFDLGAYDHSRPLTIDPTVALNNLAYSTFLGPSPATMWPRSPSTARATPT